MVRLERNIYPLYVIVDLFFSGISFYIPYILRYNKAVFLLHSQLPNYKEYSFIFILWFIFLFFAFSYYRLYFTDRNISIPREIARVILGVFCSSVIIAVVIFFAQYKFFSRIVFIGNILLLVFFLSVWRVAKRIILRRLIANGFHNINVLILGSSRIAKVVLEEIKRNSCWGFKLVGFLGKENEREVQGLPVLGKLSDFLSVCRKYFIDEIIVTLPYESSDTINIIKSAQKMHLGVRVVPNNFEEVVPLADVQYLGVIPLLTYKQKIHYLTLALKRIFDFFVSLLLLIVLSPVFLIISLFIKIDSDGPVLYKQKRSGRKGRVFKLYKFRSMIKGADKMKVELADKNEVKDGVLFKIRNDPRVTRVGRFLRRYSLDELPQLFNVLRGDMSLVGPRPPTLDEVKQYNDTHMQRLSIHPGITGLSQVRGRSDLTFHRWIRWDLWYVNNWSFWLDLYILFQTIPVVIKGKGAY